MTAVYLACVILGGAFLVYQFVTSLLGVGDQHDLAVDHELPHDLDHDGAHDALDHEHEHSWFVGVLSIRALVAALVFFGIGGMIGTSGEHDPVFTFLAAVAMGVVAMFTVAWMMRGLSRLRAEGTLRIERTVGFGGDVYLTIPARRAGAGKVTLTVQGRTVEMAAVTDDEAALPTGSKIVVVGVVDGNTVEVSAA
jgi:hypothetical protein